MFYELIYTRCRQGMDITRKGQQISSDGYKVYSCTPAILEEGAVDLQFLSNAAQAKQSFTDPGFMDDAYLFYVPDSGKSFFMNFHPVHFDPNAPGDYAHRPGNFVNHALIGDFSQWYPYEMFNDNDIWSARTRSEAYYYENEPAALPERGDITNPPGQYKFDEIGAFIADGRKEALQKAVAFLVAQYKEEPEKRKYLVIRDDSSKNIELWIAAIECAFSPQIASVIPFATRMDKFANLNRYTVKLGVYQQQMNLQDPNHKQRYRAMIVGVNEQDKANAGAAKPLANSPFVLLDGKQKQAQFEADTSARYYQLITQFDGEHQKFCREVLPTFCVSNPGIEIYELYEIYTMFDGPSMPNAQKLAGILSRLGKYRATATDTYREIYNRVKGEAARCMQEDFSIALDILNWLQKASGIAGDTNAKQWLTETVCNEFTNIVFSKKENTVKRSLWAKVRNTEFGKDVARVISDYQKIKENGSNLNAFTSVDAVTFTEIYLDSVILADNLVQQNFEAVIKHLMKICNRDKDAESLKQIVALLSRIKNINAQDILFALAKGDDKGLTEFIMKYLISCDTSIFTSDNSLGIFCKKLNDGGLGHLINLVLKERINTLGKSSEKERFIGTIKGMPFIKEDILTKVFEDMDAKIDTSANSDSSFVEFLQMEKPNGANCKNSAHLFALSVLARNSTKKSYKDLFKELKAQDFPGITDEKYINTLAEHLIKAKLDEKEVSFFIDILFPAPKEYFSVFLDKLIQSANKNRDKWNILIDYVSDEKDKQKYDSAFDDIVQALVNSGQNEKTLAGLKKLLEDEKSIKYFDKVIAKAMETISTQKPKSGGGKFFGSKKE